MASETAGLPATGGDVTALQSAGLSTAPISPRFQLPALSPPTKSLLPAWLLATTAAVEASAAQRGLVEARLLSLRRDTLVLEGHMDRARPCYASRMQARVEAARQRGDAPDEADVVPVVAVPPPPKRAQGLHRLPAEVQRASRGLRC
jgi:hypothetical protein